MASVFNENGFTGHIFPLDHEPAHTHVFKGNGEVLLTLAGQRMLRSWGMKAKDVSKAAKLVVKHNRALWEKWDEYHG